MHGVQADAAGCGSLGAVVPANREAAACFGVAIEFGFNVTNAGVGRKCSGRDGKRVKLIEAQLAADDGDIRFAVRLNNVASVAVSAVNVGIA